MLKVLLLSLLLIPLSSFAFFSNSSGTASDSLKSTVSQHAGSVKDMGFKQAQKLYEQMLGTEAQQQALLQKLVDHYPQVKRCVSSGTNVSGSLECMKSFFNKKS